MASSRATRAMSRRGCSTGRTPRRRTPRTSSWPPSSAARLGARGGCSSPPTRRRGWPSGRRRSPTTRCRRTGATSCAPICTSLRPGSRKFGLGAPGCDVQGPQKRREPFRQALVRNLRARHIRDAPQDVPGCGEGGRRRLQPVRVRRAAGHRHGAAHPPPVEGIRALVDSLDPRKPMEFALRAAVGSGMRRGEIVGLDVRDIDFEAGEIHVVHGTDSLGRQKDTKTAASKRALPMPASLKADLRERIAAIEEMFAETRKETGSPWPVLGDDTPLMCNELGERMRPHSVTRWWECHRDGYGCQGMTLHDMRHSYLTAMARKKTDPKVLQVLAGHAKYSTTMDIYTHVDMAQKHEAVEAMDW
ncbi:tyrosine-type recombinase/integrase [Adlercreutzia equolifaciens]|uniref:Tyrosine-type recombinase/integrase n=2 Tax=Adlercreutzia TaxID=447020 RepID=A0A7K1T265_9ACTN|nr:tyrosine-type recombinase/integrase [Adlercreutzia rubneri]